jgi:hypothetical protein
VIAHFRVHAVNGIDCDYDWWDGDPEPFFRAGVMDDWTTSVLQSCPNGCQDDGVPTTTEGETIDAFCQSWPTRCGNWNFSDYTIDKTINNGSGAYFYFGLFDYDPSDANDTLGQHRFFADARSDNQTVANNNWPSSLTPYYRDGTNLSTVCSQDLEDHGWANWYSLNYTVWFTDSTAPTVSQPTHVDSAPDGYNNNSILTFDFTASEPHSGLSAFSYTLRDETTGGTTSGSTSNDGTVSFCPSGCNHTYSLVVGHEYSLRLSATNGNYPLIDSPATTTSSWSASIFHDNVARLYGLN